MSPVAHAAIGFLGWGKFASRRNMRTLAVFILVANLPDIDFLFFLIVGKVGHNLHQFYTHNLMFTLLVPFFFFPLLKESREKIALVLVSVSHLFLDILMVDPVSPIGFPVFYPFWDRVFNLGIFPNLLRSNTASIFSAHNAAVIGLEIMTVVVPVLLMCRKEIFRVGERGGVSR